MQVGQFLKAAHQQDTHSSYRKGVNMAPMPTILFFFILNKFISFLTNVCSALLFCFCLLCFFVFFVFVFVFL